MPITVNVDLRRTSDPSYQIVIGTTLARAASNITRLRIGSTYFVITDTNVGKLYGNQFMKELSRHTNQIKLLTVPAGERSKSRKMKERLEDKLLSHHAGRDSVIIALGGGMIGDLAGFVAATLHRGVAFIQIPTSLLAQVDSSIGGKVAVDHPKGKNLLGAFYQPKKVYIDTSTLRSLSQHEFTNGIAEVVKYACILDAALFSYLEKNIQLIMKRKAIVLNHIITRCCKLKGNIVEQDEWDTDARRILNFGHTIGHAIEAITDYRIPHGRAVAIGIVAEGTISASSNMISRTETNRIKKLLEAFGLPTQLPSSININQLLEATEYDKKAQNGIVHYTLLAGIGRGKTGVSIPYDKVRQLLGS